MTEHSLKGFLLGTFLLLPTAATADVFSIMHLSDSQYYAERHPEILEAQIDWIVANQVAENIIYVVQTGDLKDDGLCDNKTVSAGTGANRTEWQIADQAYSDLDTANIPYGVLPGNHDFEPVSGACPTDWFNQRTFTNYDSFFGPGRFAGDPFYGDPSTLTPGNRVTGSNEDNFTLFESDGVKFIAINLAFRMDAQAIASLNPELTWANNLLQTYPDRLGIVTSHYFMETHDGPVFDNPFGPYGADVYGALAGNRNLFMMLAGHWYGESWRSETTGRGSNQPVQVLMANYQAMQFPDDTDPTTPPGTPTPNPALIDFANNTAFRGGAGNTDSGYMRIMRFDTDTGMVDIETFIPPVVPIKNRTGTIVSNNTVTSGASMGEFTASNLSFSYEGYVTTNKAYVANSGSGTVSVIDTFTNLVVDTITVGGGPFATAAHPGQNLVFVTNQADDTVSVIDTGSDTVIQTIAVGDNPQGIAVNPAQNKAYVTNAGAIAPDVTPDTVSIIDTDTLTVTNTITVGAVDPIAVAVAPDIGNCSGVFVANFANNTVTVLDTTTDAVLTTVSLAAGSRPISVAFHRATVRMYVLGSGNNSLSKIFCTTYALDEANTIGITPGGAPTGLAVDPSVGGDIYVSWPQSDTLSVTEYVFDQVVAQIPVGDFPTEVAFDPSDDMVYVSNCSDGTVSVVDISNNQVVDTITVGSCPREIAFMP